MSHTAHERAGGYLAGQLEHANGIVGNGPGFRAFTKRYHRREARRESRRIAREALIQDAAEAEAMDEYDGPNLSDDDSKFDDWSFPWDLPGFNEQESDWASEPVAGWYDEAVWDY